MDEVARLSPSIANIVISRSALHGWAYHSKLGALEREPSEAMERGKVLEAIIMGSVKEVVYMIDAENYRTKAAQEERDLAREKGLIPMLAGKYTEYVLAGEALRGGLEKRGITWEGEKQKTVLWESEGCPCKGILDHYTPGLITDLKTCENANPVKIQRSLTDYGYDIQAAAYIEGIETTHPELAGRVKFRFVFCEVSEPYGITVAELAGSFRELGQRKWARAKKTWAECLRTNVWPGYEGITRLEPKPWQLEQGEDAEPELKEGESNAQNHD